MEMMKWAHLGKMFRPRRHINLDHNATTPVTRSVRRRICQVLKHHNGNPSAMYGAGRAAHEILESARQEVARAVGASPAEITFSSCATESNNTILKSLANNRAPGRTTIISSPIEHPSVFRSLEYLKHRGIVVKYCRVDRHGRVDPADIEALIDEQTFLVCCMLASNDLGTVQDLGTIAKIAHRHGLPLFSDCVQALGKIPVDLHGMGVDFATFSAHKLHGPKGVGAMYIRKGLHLDPYMHGGHQETERRAGTEGLHNIAGFGRACRDIPGMLSDSQKITQQALMLRDEMLRIFPESILNSPRDHVLPNTLNITIPGMPARQLLATLDRHNIAMSSGSACSANSGEPSRILLAIGLSEQEAGESIRISLGHSTRRGDLHRSLKVLRRIAENRTEMVPLLLPGGADAALLQKPELFFLDVRPAFLSRQLPFPRASACIPFTALSRRLRELPEDRTIVTVCQKGNLSCMAASYLMEKGFKDVYSLEGGTVEWLRQYR